MHVCSVQTAAAVLDVLDLVLASQHTMGFSLVRPPGHHVKATRPMGFGLLNFIAVAARHALQHRHISKVNWATVLNALSTAVAARVLKGIAGLHQQTPTPTRDISVTAEVLPN